MQLILLRVVLNIGTIRNINVWFIRIQNAKFRVAWFPVWGFWGSAHTLWSIHSVILSHHLFAFDSSHFLATSTCLAAFGPFGHCPFDWTVQNVTVLTVWGRWLGAHVVWYSDSVPRTLSDLMDAGYISEIDDLASLDHEEIFSRFLKTIISTTIIFR